MSRKKESAIQKLLNDELSLFLDDNCFFKIKNYSFGDASVWFRKWGWKNDLIILRIEYNQAAINFEIDIPPNPESDLGLCDIAGNNLAQINKHDSYWYPFPFFKIGQKAYVKKVLYDLEAGLRWLSQYDTPGGCLELYLQDQNINHNSPDGRYIQKYLRDVPDELNQVCCLLNAKIEYPDPFVRALFDVNQQGPMPKSKERN